MAINYKRPIGGRPSPGEFTMTEPVFQTTSELAKAIIERKISSLELLEATILRVEKYNQSINAIVATDYECARQKSREADKALAEGKTLGPLHGIPFTVKDTFETAGLTTTAGSPHLKDHIPEKNAAVIENLINAGAIVFGKSNAPIFAMDFQSYNDVYGQTNNPWQLDRIPGGSSGGAAAALAAGLTPFEVGSDIGGSIRNPAHFCGVFGHKPSHGIVPGAGHIPPPPGVFPGEYNVTSDIAVFGPLARSAEDLELLLKQMISPPAPEKKAFRIELPPPRKKNLKELRIGLWLDDPYCPVDSLVGDRLQDVVNRLNRTGANIKDQHPPIDFKRCVEVYSLLLNTTTSASLPANLYDPLAAEVEKLDDKDKSAKAQMIRGATQSCRNWQFLNYERLIMRQIWADYFKEFDVLLCPVVPVTAFPHDHTEFFDRTLKVNNKEVPYLETLAAWAGFTGVTYLPSTVIPTGTASNGLPVGMQIVGPYLEDLTSIQAASLISEVIGGFTPPPGF
jgi:amidase